MLLLSTYQVVFEGLARLYIADMTKSNLQKSKTDKNKDFGIRLKSHRKARGLSQDELAEAVNRSTEAISKMERGLTFPGVDLLIDIASELDISIDALLGLEHPVEGSKERVELTSEAMRIITSLDGKPLQTAVEQLRALQKLVSD